MARPVTLYTLQWGDLSLETVCQKAKEFGYDGVELGLPDHVDVRRTDTAYYQGIKDLLKKYDLRLYAISTHLVGQAVCDNIDERHKAILPDYIWGDGDPEGVHQRATEEMIRTAHAAKMLGVDTVVGFTGSSIWHYLYSFPPVTDAMIQKGYDDFAGLTVANQLNRKGYEVTVFEKDELPGGLLRFGIPNFKLGKHIIDRRIRIMEQEGILFRVNTMVGKEILAKDVVKDFDAVCVAIGAEVPRDLSIEGRHLRGVHFALELLSQQNRILEGIPIPPKSQINCKGKKVLVIGGGDTGSDCVGTANRHGAACVTQIEIMPQPPVGQNPATPWPMYPQVLKTSSSHEEGCIRRWNLASNRFIGEKNNLIGVEVEEVEWVPSPDGGRPQMRLTGKKEIIEADLVFLAMGFLHPEQEGLIKELRLATDNRDNIAVDNAGYTANSNLFACGDAVSGASLVVKAMASGRNVARSIDRFLQTN